MSHSECWYLWPMLAQESGPVVQPGGGSYFLDVLLVLVLVGIALFTVCRSSRRS